MDKQTATQLIGDTFNYPFDEGRFRNFAINLLNDVNEQKGFDYLSGTYIRHSFKNHITKYRRLGSYTDPNGEKIDVLVVQLKNEWALERSRTMLRNFTSNYLKNRDEKDAALVAYYTTNPDDWRFSYIRMEYKREKAESGKFKITQDITPAKRYSYLVGKNEPNHTAQAQLVDILADDRNNPTLTELETAFSIDAVTKQFYKDYRAQFEKLWEELNNIVDKDPKIAAEFETKTIDTANFAKKLMGQIVFLYFLQKKGWLGVGKDESGNFKEWGTGPKNFLHRLFKNEFTDYGNFFNDVLEPLFYEALATERTNDVFTHFNCKIPFLNGGLFEPINDYNWEETDIRIDNDLIGDVFKTFDQYNFTVREDEPLEKEVAVDPEMLGKVFENLLPENLRKGKGAYYTPRTIVHYMCQESLINYLDTECEPVSKEDIETLIREGEKVLEYESKRAEELAKDKNYKGEYSEPAISIAIDENAQALDDALANIKVCDPAIGSGAFPVGMLTEIVKARKVLEELYLAKKHGFYELKRHCIQNSLYGVDIDPGAIEIAKLRLWLSLVVDEDDYTNIQPLPNLDYKIMQGNSLIEEFHGISLDIEKKSEQKDLFAGGSDLDALIDNLHQKQDDFFNAEHPKDKKKKRDAVESAIFNIFHNELEKKRNISPQETQDIETDLKEMTHGNKERNFFPWKLYFADVFREKGGFNVVITNPPYIDSEEMVKTLPFERQLYSKLYKSTAGNWDIYIPFTEQCWNILNNTGFEIVITPNKWLSIKYGLALRELITRSFKYVCRLDKINVFEAGNSPVITGFGKKENYNYVKIDEFDSNFKPIVLTQTSKKVLQNNNWGILLSDNIELLNKMTDGNHKISDDFEVENPFTTSEAYSLKEILDDRSKTENDFYLINTGTIDPYVTLWGKKKTAYLKLKLDRPVVTKENLKIFSTRRFEQSSSPKIIITGMRHFEAFYDADGEYIAGKSTIIVKYSNDIDLIYLLPILNSKALKFFIKGVYSALGIDGGINFSKNLVEDLPLPVCSKDCNDRFKLITDQILNIKKTNPQADTTSLEAEIDQLVYDLYGLTDEEIQIVEESVG